VLVHNAGVLPRERRETEEGVELTFATNVLGPHLLTRLLRDRLVASAPARVLFVSSGGMYTRRLDVDDLQSRRGTYDGRVAYARSKRAEVVLAERWAAALAGTGVVVHAMHPGWADTPGIKSSLPAFQRMRSTRACVSGVSAVSPSTSAILSIGMPSSSAAIWRIATRKPVPTSTLLVKSVAVPSG